MRKIDKIIPKKNHGRRKLSDDLETLSKKRFPAKTAKETKGLNKRNAIPAPKEVNKKTLKKDHMSLKRCKSPKLGL